MGILEGKVALITGVASKRSMGHAIALRLASEGANIVLIDKYAKPNTLLPTDKEWGGLEDVAKEVKSRGKEALAAVADITIGKEIDAALSKAVNKFGKIDILVHCAAIRGPVGTQVIDLSEEDWKKILDINLNGTFLVAKAVAKNMIAGQNAGKIVLISSLGGIKGMPGSAGYSASKYGVIGLAKSLALELAKYKINVNIINPGSVDTNLRDGLHQQMAKAEGISIDEARQKDWQKLISGIPLGRLAAPEEIANLVLFLVSDQSSYITGEYINIAGGLS
jgi:NAD(P)-dependent dehydrogenase (short-subunit alcohol dehydrogenase family)